MLKKLTLKNFQSHKDSVLEFSPGVNIIVGSSDSGKTAIIRALRLAIYNRPSGDAVRSYWGGVTSVEAVFDNCTVTRTKDKAEYYQLNDTLFKAFGTNVPEEISSEINLSEVNLQSQMDKPFLISNTPGEVASYFNKIANLDKIDLATSNVNKWIRTLSADIAYEETQKKKLTEELQKYENLQKYEMQVEVLESLESRRDSAYKKSAQLVKILTSIEGVEEEIGTHGKVLSMEPYLDRLLLKMKECKELAVLSTKLSSIVSIYTNNEGDMQLLMNFTSMETDLINVLSLIDTRKDMVAVGTKLKSVISDLYSKKVEIEEFDTIIKAEEIINTVLQMYNTKNTVSSSISGYSRTLTAISNTYTQLQNTEAEYERLLEQFTEEMGDVCILCDQPIKH